ncbi:DUF2157 domain-containing protein [Actinocorallia sp. A-T 12471]|uniref:DUF2157 domain-containing protein n=1 Tax=Actinocorallia sp. A-T 12471 TaxID=3089813 RepID=UPI0029CDC2B2|nr:DUF2157 domain-containing protein [Actinocorallia sp. A-T 12471]MDX6744251.1 DUF2157 domain-containing protein [Actinocorallia sp. A-T 12471]
MEKVRVSGRRLGWLRKEIEAWEAEGIVDGEVAAALRGRYVAGRRVALERVALILGAAFVGVGLLWVVAANYERMSPLVRFLGITVIWLAAVGVGEVVAARFRGALPEAVRVIAVCAAGGVVFQGAQSLQVPAGSTRLLAAWALGALAYAYATRTRGTMVVAVGLSVGWYCWWTAEHAASHGLIAVAMLVAAALVTALAVLHEPWIPEFAPLLRPVGVLLALAGLFTVAFPDPKFQPTWQLWAGAGLTVVLAAVAAWRNASARIEVAAVLGVLVAGFLMALWGPEEPSLVRAITGIAVYVVVAAWFALLGATKGLPGVTPLATAALVLFVTTQSFAIFAPLFSGAALFLVLGAVLLGTGVAAHRARNLIPGVSR